MRDGQDRGCHEPRQPHDGADRQHHPDHQQVQVVPATLLRDREDELLGLEPQAAAVVRVNSFFYQQFMFLAVDDDSSYLLVHKDEDGAEKCRNRCSQDRPPRIAPDWVDQPTSVVSGGLMFD